ncbi:MAG: terpene cyclase/mutase family protein [Pirellulales bacterium]|nr:terpene cyclase/mutase family protein [Pirellulales bacterium]
MGYSPPSRMERRLSRREFNVLAPGAMVSAAWLSAGAWGRADEPAATAGPDPKEYTATVDRGVRFLVGRQLDDGSLSAQLGIGPTALAALALLRLGRSPNDPRVARTLAFIMEYTQESGGIHAPASRFSNYETCVALVALREANRDGRYDEVMKQADAFLRDGIIDEADGKEKSDPAYGGAGYGRGSRPDLSNTAYLVDALRAAGADPKDEALQKALAFVSRCQNLEGPHNTTRFAAKINDGGFYYTPMESRQEGTRELPGGGLRSYGAMTYSGLKSMIYAGVDRDDPRVKAAVAWIRKHYDLSSNPGMGTAGLYYYYHTLAKALDALGEDPFEDAQGVKHDWRRELVDELARRQQADGSWVNDNGQWMESDPNLATAFALLALSYCKPRT